MCVIFSEQEKGKVLQFTTVQLSDLEKQQMLVVEFILLHYLGAMLMCKSISV